VEEKIRLQVVFQTTSSLNSKASIKVLIPSTEQSRQWITRLIVTMILKQNSIIKTRAERALPRSGSLLVAVEQLVESRVIQIRKMIRRRRDKLTNYSVMTNTLMTLTLLLSKTTSPPS